MERSNTILQLFPNTRQYIFRLPSVRADTSERGDSHTVHFINELLSLERCAKRNLHPNYVSPNGQTGRIDLDALFLDVPSFYLFAHKALVSCLFMFRQTIPAVLRQGVPAGSYDKFMAKLTTSDNRALMTLNANARHDMEWAQKKIIYKRDKMVQHWQTNDQGKLSPMVETFNLPMLVYCDASRTEELPTAEIDSLCGQARVQLKRVLLDENLDAVGKLAWLEAWYPNFNRQLQSHVDLITDYDLVIPMPVTPQLVNRLDKTMASILQAAVSLAPTGGQGVQHGKR